VTTHPGTTGCGSGGELEHVAAAAVGELGDVAHHLVVVVVDPVELTLHPLRGALDVGPAEVELAARAGTLSTSST
jgi:hypothetical protein